MKIPSHRRPHGFTLVELLVVIAIIAVLASAGFSAGNAAIQRAKKVTALSTATAIESAVNNFFTEYGSMPASGTGALELDTTTGAGLVLLRELLGHTSSTQNTRKVNFLSVKEGKKRGTGGINGLVYDNETPAGLYDPWGGPYKVLLDLDYEEKLRIPNTVLNGNKTLNGRRVAVWSLGADGVAGSGGKKADDVITWN